MNWTNNYKKAKRYGDLLDYSNSEDLVHDAWLYWKEKKGEDLFEVADKGALMFRLMKNLHQSKYQKEKQYQYNHERHTREFYNHEYLEFVNKFKGYTSFLEIMPTFRSASNAYIDKTSKNNVDEHMDYVGLCEKIIKNIQKMPNHITRKHIFDMKADGYTNKEIAEKMGISEAMVSYFYKNLIKS